MIGNISSIETLGTLDGPGIRFVVFFYGCSLRCKYCHNPETWHNDSKYTAMSALELVEKIDHYKNYFGENGGVTFSGGEPLLQPEFLVECLKLCKEKGIHTCIDTAGVGLGDYHEILKYTDLVILDVKAIDETEYRELTGRDISHYNNFLSQLKDSNCKVWIRQVIVPGINNTKENVINLKNYALSIPNVEKIELLPYKTMGIAKYKSMGIPYSLENTPELSQEELDYLNTFLEE